MWRLKDSRDSQNVNRFEGMTMKEVYLNRGMLKYCSFGVRNYANRLQQLVSHSQSNSLLFINIWRGFFVYNKDSVLWSPGQGGSLLSRSQIVTVHDVIDYSYYGKNSLLKKIKYAIHNFIYSRCKCIVFISDYSRCEFEKIFNINNVEKITIKSPLFMGDNIVPINPLVGDYYFLRNKTYFLLITNGMDHKNNRIFLDAIIRINKINPDVAGVVVGELSQIDLEILSHNKSSLFNFQKVTNDDILSLIEYSAGLCSCSKVEGHNLTAAEAISLKKICILSDIPVHREFYDGYALFFEHDSVDQLVELMSRTANGLVEDPDKLHDIANQRSWNDVAEEYRKLFNRL